MKLHTFMTLIFIRKDNFFSILENIFLDSLVSFLISGDNKETKDET